MSKILIIGGGWAGCGAALIAAKQGAEVTLLEKTDLLLGAGNAGGIMRNNGRFTAAEENIALGAPELFQITDRYAVHNNVDFPGHDHASFYDITKVETAVRRLLTERGIDIRFGCRAVDVRREEPFGQEKRFGGEERAGREERTGKEERPSIKERPEGRGKTGIKRILAVKTVSSDASFHGSGEKDHDGRPGALSGSCKLEKKSLSRKLQKKN